MATTPQRAYRAACPNCGAPVEFASAASASAVCGFCRSTLVRDGDALRRIGVSAELFDDHSPLQLQAAGRYQGAAFTLVGRLQHGYFSGPQAAAGDAALAGTWNEWHALFDNGKSGWLSEDNGAYVFAFDQPLQGSAPPADELVAGERRLVHGTAWNVASVTHARLLAAQGELPRPPRLDSRTFVVADLRNERDEVGTLDYGDAAGVQWSIGRSVRLADLALSGLREAGEKTLGRQAFQCPSCGASLGLLLATTQSIVCHQCKAVVDVSQGVGGDLAHYAQANSGHDGAQPQIPLGRSGRIALGGAALDWQVVGYQERCFIPTDPEDDRVYWREYLLFNRGEGFVFLVDGEDGWSWAKPLTGAPQVRGSNASWSNRSYRQREEPYDARVTWVLGEFYWRVRRDERARVTDYVGTGGAAERRLSREETRGAGGSEVTWSEGGTLQPAAIVRAFGLAPEAETALQRATPGAAKVDSGLAKVLLIVAVVAVVLLLGFCSSRDRDCADVRAAFGDASNEYQQCLRNQRSGGIRSGGGSFGGFSSGGSHK
ncbi:MAG: DUF4178 domain-containing protein [Ideonella sp.]|nr:DUF4178 domain-containing protein [Ideonella sp.]MCC7455835.1 DUF4178 domain-containing protein [Nitrospira sp.]